MGVTRTDYIIYGYKLPYEVTDSKGETINFRDREDCMSMIEGHEGEKFTLIIDGMCGEYIAFGLLIDSAEDDGGWDFVELDFKTLTTDKKRVKQKYREVFDIIPEEVIADPSLLIFSYYS